MNQCKVFNKSMDQLGDGLGGKKILNLKWKNFGVNRQKKSNDTNFITGKKQKSNLEKIWGTSFKEKILIR
jgi:hypothetical protein